MSLIQWVKFSTALAPAINAMVKDLYALTRGDAVEAEKHITRIRDDWHKLDEVRAETDARLGRLEKE